MNKIAIKQQELARCLLLRALHGIGVPAHSTVDELSKKIKGLVKDLIIMTNSTEQLVYFQGIEDSNKLFLKYCEESSIDTEVIEKPIQKPIQKIGPQTHKP